MKIKVESAPDAKGQESPTRFLLGSRIIEVEEVSDRWFGEQACYFRVLGSDQNSYILRDPWKTAAGSLSHSRIRIPGARSWKSKARESFSKSLPRFPFRFVSTIWFLASGRLKLQKITEVYE